jgi:hypothetical protein
MGKFTKDRARVLGGRVLEGLSRVAEKRIADFAFEAFDDDLFALGYPHLALLYEDETDPKSTAEKLILVGYPYREVAFPRRAAVALLRAYLNGPATVVLPTGKAALSAHATAAAADAREFTPDEAGPIVAALARGGAGIAIDSLLYLVESLVGTRATIEHMLKAVEPFPAVGFFRRSQVAAIWLTTFAMMLERCPDPEPLAAKARAWADGAGLDAAQRTFTGIGSLYGQERVEAPFAVVHASRERVIAARTAARTTPWYGLPDPRLVFLGGDAVFEIELALWSKYTTPYAPAVAHRLTLERFGRIRSPRTVALVSAMLEKSKAKKEAKAWLELRRDYAVPELRSLASADAAHAAACRAALELLSAT